MRDQLLLVGTSFRRVGFDALGRCVLPEDRRELLEHLREACGASEMVYVATCNRVEIYLYRPARSPALDVNELPAIVATFFTTFGGKGPVAADTFFVREGARALEHLFRVVASLDSLVVGECEIARQVRKATDAALADGLAGSALKRIFEQASRAGRRVRTETAIGQTPVSVASLVVRIAREHFDGAPRRAVLVGVSDVTKKVAASLERDGTRLLFVNRTRSRADELATKFKGESLSLESFLASPPADVDLVVTATRAPEPIIGEATLRPRLEAGSTRNLLVCDLGVPPNVVPATAGLAGVRLVTLPDLEAKARVNQERLAGEIDRAAAIVADEVRKAHNEMRLCALAEESVDAILAARLAHLPDQDQETVRRFAVQLAERMARQPLEVVHR